MEQINHGHFYDYDLKKSSELSTNEIINEFRIYQNKFSFYLISEIEKCSVKPIFPRLKKFGVWVKIF